MVFNAYAKRVDLVECWYQYHLVLVMKQNLLWC
jgi:hypothetical protein